MCQYPIENVNEREQKGAQHIEIDHDILKLNSWIRLFWIYLVTMNLDHKPDGGQASHYNFSGIVFVFAPPVLSVK